MIVAEHPIIITFAYSRKIFVEAQQRKDSILWCLVICKFKKHWRYIDHCQRVTFMRGERQWCMLSLQFPKTDRLSSGLESIVYCTFSISSSLTFQQLRLPAK